MILIIDDDPVVRTSLSFLLRRAGYEPEAVSTPEETLALIRKRGPRLVLMDMNFGLGTSGEEGIHLLKQVKIFHPDVPIILITAWGSISLAVEGMRAGAFDFVTKPWNNLQLLDTIGTALEISRQKQTGTTLIDRDYADKNLHFEKIIGKSSALMGVLTTVSRIAPTNASVLITGESGTGKELIAEAIHANSLRAGKPFVKVNLGGLPQSLFESEMFGHKQGAFTDARGDRTGRFEMADKGTIFLDEIGDLDFSCQVKLLRVLQDQTYEVLGDSKPRKTDVRVISATNADLPAMLENHTFREDLYYRINLITLHLPPLRERSEDIPLLAAHFAAEQCRTNLLPPVKFTSAATCYLQSLPLPGNVRELKNLIDRTVLISGKTVLDAEDFRNQNLTHNSRRDSSSREGLTLEELERESILKALKSASGNISLAASTLGISRSALYRRMEKYEIRG